MPGWFDELAALLLVPLTGWILLSGLDDLFVALIWLCSRSARRSLEAPSADLSEKRTAILVPLWHEHSVIERMLATNLSGIRYSSYDFFMGVYPNDPSTREAVQRVQRWAGNVHLIEVPHDGPTSKADCLNWIYWGALRRERETGARFEVFITHDAEDVIHPEALHWLSRWTVRYDMVQIPVLPLPTPIRLLTHGVYCDEFAESQTKDLPVRERLGGFLPSTGVGTGYSRWGLEKLAASASHRLFEPACLTEDYDNGLRLHLLHCPQLFVPVFAAGSAPLATREYFPQRARDAIRQRTRWVTGIALQGWERNGWRGGWRQVYWFWRDRKGLVGNPAGLVANGIFVYGAVSYLASRLDGLPWGLAQAIPAWLLWPLSATSVLQILHLCVRANCSARVYGWRFAAGVPLRFVYGNWINCMATFSAIHRYFWAKLRGRSLAWAKTDHIYPGAATLGSAERS